MRKERVGTTLVICTSNYHISIAIFTILILMVASFLSRVPHIIIQCSLMIWSIGATKKGASGGAKWGQKVAKIGPFWGMVIHENTCCKTIRSRILLGPPKFIAQLRLCPTMPILIGLKVNLVVINYAYTNRVKVKKKTWWWYICTAEAPVADLRKSAISS